MSFTKQTPTKPGAYWWKQRPDQCAFLVERFKDGTYRMAGTGIIYNVDMLECGEWCGPLVPIADVKSVIADVSHLRNEVDCRIDHGAQHGGHLDYVRLCLTQIIDAHR